MATLSQYFERHDTPMADSPVGRTMAKILAKYPEMTFEEARAEAHVLLADAAKRRRYVAPEVLSVEEKAAQPQPRRHDLPSGGRNAPRNLRPPPA